MTDKTLVSQYDGVSVKVGDHYARVDRGAAVPDDADADHVKLLKDRGLVAEGEPVAGVDVPVGPAPFDVDEDAAKSGRRSAAKSG